ncbi:MAG TPA: PHP domain-containing protein [Trichocoleus sp.]|jgi:predicted metal-dependent phosphoesterase TrpH
MAVNLALGSDVSAAQDSTALRSVFESLTAASCPHHYNFHIHTVYSDGRLRPEQVLEQAIELGLKGLAITDHHSTSGYQVAQQWLMERQNQHPDQPSPHLWTGIEINADLLGVEVHILGYAFEPRHPALAPYQTGYSTIGAEGTAQQVITALHEAGGLAVLAHPARYKRSHSELVPAAAEAGVDGIETFYAYNNPSPWKPSPKQTAAISALGKAYALLNTCGTDSHGLTLLQRL